MNSKYKHELAVYLPLAFVGGFLEIYTYVNMSGLFANAQTSNLVLLFNGLLSGNISSAVYCVMPVILYILGITVTELTPKKMRDPSVRWPEYCVFIEAVCMAGVAFCPKIIPARVSALPVFFLTAMQYNTFKSMQGQGVSTVFCTNNLRQAVIHFWRWKEKKDGAQAVYMSVYVFVIGMFILGVVAGFSLSHLWGVKAVLACVVVMAFVFLRLRFHGHKFLI